MMRNCTGCNAVFVHPHNTLCPQCVKERNAEFNKVKVYLQRHPKSKLQEIVNETGVSLDRVREFVAEGRLKIIPIDLEINCQICGSLITTGRICQKCQAQLSKKSDESTQVEKGHTGRMHLLNSKRRGKQ